MYFTLCDVWMHLFIVSRTGILVYCVSLFILFILTLQELQDENGRLHKLVGEKEEEVKIIKRRWKDDKKELAGKGALLLPFIIS